MFPASTEFGKRIPKQKFYENLDVSPALRRVFVDQIRLEIRLNGPQLDEAVLKQIDREIPYHILFILTCDGKAQAWIGHKSAAASGSSAFKVNRYYHTDWIPENEIDLRIDGLTLDAVYDNFVKQVAELQGEEWNANCGAAENVAQSLAREKLKKQIAALEKKMRREKQLNRQMEMHAELKKLQIELRQIT